MKPPYTFDSKCKELAEYFLGLSDPRLNELAQELQDVVELFTEQSLDRLKHDRETLRLAKHRNRE